MAAASPALEPGLGQIQPVSLELADDAAAVMPRVERLSLRQAMQTLAPFNVRIEVNGRGLVQSQQPAAGAPLTAGTVCRLTLASPTAGPAVSP